MFQRAKPSSWRSYIAHRVTTHMLLMLMAIGVNGDASTQYGLGFLLALVFFLPGILPASPLCGHLPHQHGLQKQHPHRLQRYFLRPLFHQKLFTHVLSFCLFTFSQLKTVLILRYHKQNDVFKIIHSEFKPVRVRQMSKQGLHIMANYLSMSSQFS